MFVDEAEMLTETGLSRRDRIIASWTGLEDMRIPWDPAAKVLAQVVGEGEGELANLMYPPYNLHLLMGCFFF